MTLDVRQPASQHWGTGGQEGNQGAPAAQAARAAQAAQAARQPRESGLLARLLASLLANDSLPGEWSQAARQGSQVLASQLGKSQPAVRQAQSFYKSMSALSQVSEGALARGPRRLRSHTWRLPLRGVSLPKRS